MEPIIVAKKDKVKGLFVFCKKCDRVIEKGKCGDTGKRLSSCENTNQHGFRAFIAVPGTGGAKRKTRFFNTRDITEAIRMKLEFDEEMKANGYQQTTKHLPQPEMEAHLLIECMAHYIDFLNNVGVPEHKVKVRSKKHIGDFIRYFKYVCLCLKANDLDHTIFRIDQLNDVVVGMLHKYLIEDLKYQNKTYNKFMSSLGQFVDWLISEKGYEMKNAFSDVTKKRVTTKVVTATKDDVQKLYDVICPENGVKTFANGDQRNYYREWTKDALIIALNTGFRREEFMTLRFSDIIEGDNQLPVLIKQQNYKVNRAQGSEDKEGGQTKIVPITGDLMKVLDRLDYKTHRKTDRYLIGAEDPANRNTLIQLVTKSFSQFWAHTGIDKEISLKSLRKTYITALVENFGENAKIISNHSGIEVIKNHYLNQQQLVQAVTSFSVFK
ncbi:MAG: site-specific integrase [Bacteroidetes bacterium]|nr:site-specific integrase [Bacteroidota bacterium]